MTGGTVGHCEGAILLADVSGSTRLYRELGDVEARRQVAALLGRLRGCIARRGGVVVSEKGDDVLCRFADAGPAVAALREMLDGQRGQTLQLHAGLHHGRMLLEGGDIFGDAVNLAARLAALAKPGEACLSAAVAERLGPEDAAALQPLGRLPVRGLAAPVAVFSFQPEATGTMTRLPGAPPAEAAAGAGVALILTHGRTTMRLREGETAVIGRASGCDLVLAEPWISRRHAEVHVRAGRALIEDRSSTGTWLATPDGREIVLRREAVALPDAGVISPATSASAAEAQRIGFELLRF